ncbi:hypothetical protein D3C71_1904370 [compost metagenome]
MLLGKLHQILTDVSDGNLGRQSLQRIEHRIIQRGIRIPFSRGYVHHMNVPDWNGFLRAAIHNGESSPQITFVVPNLEAGQTSAQLLFFRRRPWQGRRGHYKFIVHE